MATLKNIMKRKVKTIRESAAFQEASRLLIKNKLSGVPVIDKNKHLKGFGFVEMPNSVEAQAAIAGLNGKEFRGRILRVNEVRPRSEGPRRGGRPGGGYRSSR